MQVLQIKMQTLAIKKALLYNMLIIKNENGNYGVQTLDGQEVLGTKYANIKFVESSKRIYSNYNGK